MRGWMVGGLAALALATAGCSGCTLLDQSQGIGTQTTLDEKVLYSVEAAFYGANEAASAAVDAGLLRPGSTQAVSVADGLQVAHSALLAARAAYAAGDARSFGAKVEAAQRLVASVWGLIPGKKEN